MNDQDWRDRVLSDLRRIETKVDGHGDRLATFGERLRAVEVRAGVVAVVATALVLVLREMFK